MSQLVIEIDTPEDETLLMQLSPKLNGRLVKKSTQASVNTESPVAILKRIAERGGVTSFGDPSEWQREMRQDRPLAGRGE